MRRLLLGLAALLAFADPAHAQITITYSFTSGTVADPSQVNTNFATLGSQALNRTGGTLTGNIAANAGVTIDGIDVGATVCATCDPTFRNLTVTSITSGTGAFSAAISVQTASISSGGGSPEGAVSGNVGDIYLRRGGGSGTTFYVKESGAGTVTGWVAK